MIKLGLLEDSPSCMNLLKIVFYFIVNVISKEQVLKFVLILLLFLKLKLINKLNQLKYLKESKLKDFKMINLEEKKFFIVQVKTVLILLVFHFLNSRSKQVGFHLMKIF